MSKKILEINGSCNTWTSYIDSMYGVLCGSGMWKEDVTMLMGMTGAAFHFIVHETCSPSSVTVYDWQNEHFIMMDRIGIHSDLYNFWFDNRLNTYDLQREAAVRRIKESIDRGVGVIAWAPTKILEFGIIKGYDDDDGVFYVQDCTGQEADPLLYKNLGKSEVPMLSYQIPIQKVEIDREKAYRESLRFAVNEWNKDFHVSPSYASGRKAYDYLAASLEKGNFDSFGLAYILSVYADSKQCIAGYLEFLNTGSEMAGSLDKTASLYKEAAGNFKQMAELFPFSGVNGVGCTADRSKAPEIMRLVKETKPLEEQAIKLIEEKII